MRRAPRVLQGIKRPRAAAPHQPPRCRKVTSEVLGVSSSMIRIDIVADDTLEPEAPPLVPEGDGWETIEDALAEVQGPPRSDPWERLTR